MNTLALPQTPRQSFVSAALSRLKSLVSSTSGDEVRTEQEMRPYSFLAECDCPDDCLRDHENE